MKQNNYFSIKRFSHLLRNDLLINQKTYLSVIIGLSIAIYALTYILMKTTTYFSNDVYTGIFTFYLMGSGVIIGTAFPALTNYIKTSNYLLVPGSVLEKFMVQFVIRIVIFIPLALMILWAATHLAKASLIPDPSIGFNPNVSIPDFHFSELFYGQLSRMETLFLVLSIFSFATVLFAGTTYFKRFALVKTLGVSGIIYGTILLSFVLFSYLYYYHETKGYRTIDFHSYNITQDLTSTKLYFYIIGGLSWLFLLPLAYFKLKEKEV